MFQKQTQVERLQSGLCRAALRVISTAGGLLLAFVMQAHATVNPGDHFNFNWTETAGNAIGLTGSVRLTVGASLGGGLFGVAGFDVTQNGGFCGVCTPETEVLTGATFNSNTFGLFGVITGTFKGSGGGEHSFVLDLADVMSGIGHWTFINTKVGDGTDTSSGTYTPLVSVCSNANPLLGAATECTILQSGSLNSNSPFKVDITGPAGGILGNICIGDHSRVTASGSNFVSGTIFLDPDPPAATCTSSAPGVNCAGATVKDLDTQSTACDDASTAAAFKTCTIGNGTQSLSNLAGPTHTITGAAGENVVCVKDVVLQAGQVINLTGTPTTTFVINVTGNFTINGGKIVVDGTNLKSRSVLYNVIGAGQAVSMTGGGGGAGCCKAEIDGTLVAIDRDIALAPGLINGQVCGGQNMSFVSGSGMRCPTP